MCSGTISCGSATMERGNSGKSRTTSSDIVARVYVAGGVPKWMTRSVPAAAPSPHDRRRGHRLSDRQRGAAARRGRDAVSERPIADEWEAQAQAWERWTRTPGHDRHFHRYNWPSFLDL